MTTQSNIVRTGRVWKFEDNINTDLIFPNAAFRLPLEEQHNLVFRANRPEWREKVQEGDILIAGLDFGMGSGRPVGRLLRECGIAGVVADSINGLALRSCVNFGMPALDCKGVTSLFAEGETARIDFSTGLVENLSTGKSLNVTPLPPLLCDLVIHGGMVPMLVGKDLIESVPFEARSK